MATLAAGSAPTMGDLYDAAAGDEGLLDRVTEISDSAMSLEERAVSVCQYLVGVSVSRGLDAEWRRLAD